MTWTRTVTAGGTVAILAMLLVAAMTVPATAAGPRDRDRTNSPGHARFEGRHIDLTTGWGDARACVVWTSDGDTDCFRTDTEAEDAIATRDRDAAPVSAASWFLTAPGEPHPSPFVPWGFLLTGSCRDWLSLHEHTGFGGRTLRFREQGHYQDLADWGFAGQTSSYRIGSCTTTLRDAGWAGYPGWTGPGASASSMSSGWNDRVRYLRIS